MKGVKGVKGVKGEVLGWRVPRCGGRLARETRERVTPKLRVLWGAFLILFMSSCLHGGRFSP